MMPLRMCAMAPGLTSGTTSGTSLSMRQNEVLSMTMAPALAARGANSAETLAPGDDSTMSTPLKSKFSRLATFSVWSPNDTSMPMDRDDAMA